MATLRSPYKYLLLALSLGVLFYLILTTRQQLYHLPSGRWVAELSANTPFDKRIEKITYKGISGNLIDDMIYYTGSWEPEILSFLKESLQKTSQNRGVFLDIGANTGWDSLYMSQYAQTVHAIEPYPPVLERFNAMIRFNKIDNIHVHPVGFSNVEGVLPFYAPADSNLGTGSFDPQFRAYNTKSNELPLVVGDAYLGARAIDQIDLVKIDIEGYERYALLGLSKILEKNRPIVMMELNPTEGGFKSREQMVNTFPRNYRFFKIQPPSSIWTLHLGPYLYIYGAFINNPQARYTLEKFDFVFDRQANLAAIPVEKLPLFQIATSQENNNGDVGQ